jgi:hypothetical protein
MCLVFASFSASVFLLFPCTCCIRTLLSLDIYIHKQYCNKTSGPDNSWIELNPPSTFPAIYIYTAAVELPRLLQHGRISFCRQPTSKAIPQATV